MPEVTPNRLETKRFVINPESLEAMKRVRDALPSLQEQYPFLAGVSFFGSRINGMEREGSDLDLYICIDISKIRSAINAHESAVDVAREFARGVSEITPKMQKIAEITLGTSRLEPLDIDKKSTDDAMRRFVSSAKDYLGEDVTDEEIDDITFDEPAQDLFIRFFLSVGDGIYKSRTYIINRFREMPRGEEYFRVLMRCLGRFERSSDSEKYVTPQYAGLPKTLDQAEKYFLGKLDLGESVTAA
jgi:hypothetical protein